MSTIHRTAFVKLVVDAGDDLDAISDTILDELTDAGFDVVAVDFRDDTLDDSPSSSISTDILS
jgi:hypothetical protein